MAVGELVWYYGKVTPEGLYRIESCYHWGNFGLRALVSDKDGDPVLVEAKRLQFRYPTQAEKVLYGSNT